MHPDGREQTRDRPDATHFATTHWSVVLAAGGRTSLESREALETLCSLYWYPLYAYVRRRGYGAEEARDLTQGFFVRLIEKDVVRTADRNRGKFRSYLLGALKHFLANEWDRAHAQKRGGDRRAVPVDIEGAESRYRLEPADEVTPEKLFERHWAVTLLELAVSQLREEFIREGKEHIFDGLREFLGGADPGRPYGPVAADLGMTEAAVKMAVHRMRRRYRELLRAEIARTVVSPGQIDDEIRHLFAVLGG